MMKDTELEKHAREIGFIGDASCGADGRPPRQKIDGHRCEATDAPCSFATRRPQMRARTDARCCTFCCRTHLWQGCVREGRRGRSELARSHCTRAVARTFIATVNVRVRVARTQLNESSCSVGAARDRASLEASGLARHGSVGAVQCSVGASVRVATTFIPCFNTAALVH